MANYTWRGWLEYIDFGPHHAQKRTNGNIISVSPCNSKRQSQIVGVQVLFSISGSQFARKFDGKVWITCNNNSNHYSIEIWNRNQKIIVSLNVMLLFPSPWIGNTNTRPDILYGPTREITDPFNLISYSPSPSFWKPLYKEESGNGETKINLNQNANAELTSFCRFQNRPIQSIRCLWILIQC